MKVGDVVIRKYGGWNAYQTKRLPGIIVKMYTKKNWDHRGMIEHLFDWQDVKEVEHAEVLIGTDIICVPVTDLVKYC